MVDETSWSTMLAVLWAWAYSVWHARECQHSISSARESLMDLLGNSSQVHWIIHSVSVLSLFNLSANLLIDSSL